MHVPHLEGWLTNGELYLAVDAALNRDPELDSNEGGSLLSHNQFNDLLTQLRDFMEAQGLSIVEQGHIRYYTAGAVGPLAAILKAELTHQPLSATQREVLLAS